MQTWVLRSPANIWVPLRCHPLFGDVNQRKGGKRNNLSQTCKHLSSLKTIKTNRVIKGTTLVGAFYIFSLAFYSYLFHILFAWIFLLLSIGFAAIGLSVEKLQKVFMRAIINKEKQKMNNERKYVFSKEGVDIVTQAGATHNYWSYKPGNSNLLWRLDKDSFADQYAISLIIGATGICWN